MGAPPLPKSPDPKSQLTFPITPVSKLHVGIPAVTQGQRHRAAPCPGDGNWTAFALPSAGQCQTLTGLGSSGFDGGGVDSYPQLRAGTQPELIQRVWFETFHSVRRGWVKLHLLLANEGKHKLFGVVGEERKAGAQLQHSSQHVVFACELVKPSSPSSQDLQRT